MGGEAQSHVSRRAQEFVGHMFPAGPALGSLSRESSLFPRLVVFAVLVGSSTLDDGSRHATRTGCLSSATRSARRSLLSADLGVQAEANGWSLCSTPPS